LTQAAGKSFEAYRRAFELNCLLPDNFSEKKMRKILTVIFLILMCVTIAFGQTIFAQARQDLQQLYQECNDALRRFYSINSFQ
jgi:hypothetical protein